MTTGNPIGASVIFRPDPDSPGDFGIDVDLTLMAMESTRSPVLIRLDPAGQWWVICQGPPKFIHAHVIDPVSSALDGYRTPWHAALAQANREATPWRALASTDPTEQLKLGLQMIDMITELRRRGEH